MLESIWLRLGVLRTLRRGSRESGENVGDPGRLGVGKGG